MYYLQSLSVPPQKIEQIVRIVELLCYREIQQQHMKDLAAHEIFEDLSVDGVNDE
jgi:hypothetical protein